MIIKKIEEIKSWILADEQLGCGFAPEDAYDSEWQKVYELETRLAKLQGFNSVEDKTAWEENNLPMNVQATIFGWY